MPNQTTASSRIALGTLGVIAFENPRDSGVTFGKQIPGQLIAAAVVVVLNGGKAPQIAISAVKEQHRDPPGPEQLIKIGVDRGQGGLYPLHQHGAQLHVQKLGQNLPLPADQVLRGEDQGGIALLGKKPLNIV